MVMDISVEKVNIYIKYLCIASLLSCSSFVLGYHSMLERATGIDLNGDGIIGRRPDVQPGYPAFLGYPSIPYGYGSYGYPQMGYGNRGFYPRFY
jgi:hypothetical protein